jgi:fibronectin-binding autotransporter adhesin
MDMVITNLNNLTAEGARRAYDQMGGLVHTATTATTFITLNGYMGTITGRTGGFLSGGPLTSSSQLPMFVSRTDIISDAGTISNPGGDVGTKGYFWTKGYGSMGERRESDISSRYDYKMGGIAVGFDRKMNNSLLLGISTGYSRTKVTMKDLSDTARIASYQASLYGVYMPGPWYTEGIVAYGYNRYDTSRDIAFAGIARRADADYVGHALSAYTETGYRFKTRIVNIIPMASLQASYLARNGFREEDAGALNLTVDRDYTSSLVSSLGVKVRRNITAGAGILFPELRARWLHEFLNDDYVLNAAFTGAPASTFTVKGDRPNRDAVALGFGLSYMTRKNLNLFVTYDATLSGDRTEHGGSLGIKYRW